MEKEAIKNYYASEVEKNRLEFEYFKLEGIRTKLIIERYLDQPSLKILDVGGGAGYYAFWLQQRGHKITLVDLAPKNIELVKQQERTSGIQLTNCELGDAMQLNFKDDEFDLVLQLGPLYHLTKKEDRVQALTEAKRVVKPGGTVLSAVISRYASLFDGFKRDLVNDEQFEKLLVNDLETGIHLNKTNNPEYFTTAYFHAPQEIKDEVKESGLQLEKLIGVESFGWIVDQFKTKHKDEIYMQKFMHFIEAVESNDDLIAMSPHIISVARK